MKDGTNEMKAIKNILGDSRIATVKQVDWEQSFSSQPPKLIRLLVIEDDPEDAELICEYLIGDIKEQALYDVAVANSLATGLAKIEEQLFDAVLLDLFLPDSKGKESIMRAIQSSQKKGVPIVVLTGLDDENTAREAIRLGVKSYLVKGEFSKKMLSRAIRTAIEKQSVESEFLKRETKLKNLVESIAEGILICKGERIVEANDTATKMLGFGTSFELIGMHFDDFVAEYFQDKLSFEKPTIHPTEIELKRRDGTLFFAEVRKKELSHNSHKEIFISLYDISERKSREFELKKISNELLRSNRDLEQFMSVASHDLQAPLHTVRSFIELLARGYKEKLDDQANEYISFAVKGTGKMQELIHNLLFYSRVGSEKQPSTLVDCNDVLINWALLNLQAAAKEANAIITFDPLPTVLASPNDVMQLFQNLVGNAIKYRLSGRRPEIHIGVTRKGRDWEFYIRDNGIGILPEHRERVFAMFDRLHSDKEYSGTGIGLGICKKIIDLYKGRIWVESEAGKGSTFYFTLPACDEA